jgi:hypothetical protein
MLRSPLDTVADLQLIGRCEHFQAFQRLEKSSHTSIFSLPCRPSKSFLKAITEMTAVHHDTNSFRDLWYE